MAALRGRGRDVVVWDTARFPIDSRVELTHGGARRLVLGDRALDLATVDTVWLLHTEVGHAIDDAIDADFVEAVQVQSELVFWDAIESIDARFVDPPANNRAIPLGTGQLALARAAGLDTPATLVTNEPDAVRDFAARFDGRLIAKMMHSSVVQRRTAAGIRPFSARRVGPAELAEIERVALCPQIFQEPLDKALDVRVTAVGRELLVAAVDSREAEVLDWSEDPALVRAFAPYTLPDDIAAGVHRLLDDLGLSFTSVDLVRTTDGRHVFLEVNGVTFFGFVESATGLPITDALAALLAGEAPLRA